MSYPKQPSYPTQPVLPPSSGAVIRSDILQTIDQHDTRLCEELIRKDPKKVNEIGWNDLTPLHQVCLRGQIKMLQILLHHGAQLDSRSSFGETPLHYACRRGDVQIMHILIKAGCDVTAVDKQERGCIHFAAVGGNLPAMHYLGTQTELNYNVKDAEGDTALHFACMHRHFFLVNYLLRNGRSDPCGQNNKGVTALHIAAQMGNTEIVWRLLTVGNCGLIHLKDDSGNTAIDSARNEATERHRQVAEALQYYAKQDPNSPPAGPKFTWWMLLLLPFSWSGLVFMLSSHFNSHSGHFAVVMFLILVAFVFKQTHRIHHAARWPNPIFLGAFAGGIIHCILAAFLRVLNELWPCPVTAVAVAILSGLCLYYMHYLVTGDPGIVRHSQVANGRQMTILDIAAGRCKEQEFCVYTELIKPEQTKYCRLCEHLTVDLDHHCLFILNCVARHNHRAFVIFIMNVMALQVFFIFEALLYTNTFYPNYVNDSLISIMFHHEPWLFDLSLLCVLAFAWESSLIFVQLKNIASGRTVYYVRHRQQPLTWQEIVKNLIRFFFKSGQGEKERTVNKMGTMMM